MTDEELKELGLKALAGDQEAMSLFMTLTEERAEYIKVALGIKDEKK